MITDLLFDWGDTLMVDFPQYEGKMRDWPELALVDGVSEILPVLASQYRLHLATNAQDSTEADIRKAFQRVGINLFFKGIFCKQNLGVDKSSENYFSFIINKLEAKPENIIMIGDNLDKDVLPAIAAGMHGIYYTPAGSGEADGYRVISAMSKLPAAIEYYANHRR